MKNKPKDDLDFSLLLEPVAISAFKGVLDRENELEKLKIPETLNRLRGASLLISSASNTSKAIWMNEAYIRAGLSEFRSVKNSILWDIKEDKNVFKPTDSKNPLVHLIFRMRRVVVYKKNFDLEQSTGDYKISLGSELYPHKNNVYLIKNIKECVFEEMKDHYQEKHLSDICEWFDQHQMKFGAPEVFNFGIMYYCHELLVYYSDRINDK